MAISLEDLISTIARGATRAQWEVKEEERRHFAMLFEEAEDGTLKPTTFTLQLLEHKVLVPWLNTMHQDQFSIRKLKLKFDTSVDIQPVNSEKDTEDKILITCSMKKGLFKRSTELSIEMDLESQSPTEGFEQIRDHFANQLADTLKGVKQGVEDE